MENASKALIIAGAILLAILIIGLAVFIYNQASNTVSETGMDQVAVRQFNAQFEPYIMNNASGVTAMALYDTVAAHNAIAESNKKVRLVLERDQILQRDNVRLLDESIMRQKMVMTDEQDVKVIKLVTPQPGLPPEDAEAAAVLAGEISFAKSELSSTKKYNIEVTQYDAGVIKEITISPVRIKEIKEEETDLMK